ncbi:MAG: hypothetical protein KC733_08890 [Candidatus Omnitrophica bacterium]|nr:hypothetical protein [Candidatus Omnitrophota bacterium]
MVQRITLLLFTAFAIMNYTNLAMAWPFQSAEEKLKVAEVMYEERDRPLRAQVLLSEARRIYEKEGDIVGIAHVNRAYAYFLKSGAVGRWSKMDFDDKTVNHSNRFQKAIDYLEKALEVYEEKRLYAYASNVHFNMAAIYSNRLDNNEIACTHLEASLQNHIKYNESNLNNGKVELLRGYDSFQEIIDKAKTEANCKRTEN